MLLIRVLFAAVVAAAFDGAAKCDVHVHVDVAKYVMRAQFVAEVVSKALPTEVKD